MNFVYMCVSENNTIILQLEERENYAIIFCFWDKQKTVKGLLLKSKNFNVIAKKLLLLF